MTRNGLTKTNPDPEVLKALNTMLTVKRIIIVHLIDVQLSMLNFPNFSAAIFSEFKQGHFSKSRLGSGFGPYISSPNAILNPSVLDTLKLKCPGLV